MSNSPLTKKLLVKPGNSVLLIEPPDQYAALLGGLPEGAQLISEGLADVVQIFGATRASLEDALPAAIASVRPGGVFWVSYPKVATGRSDLSREILWEVLEPFGWRAVTQVAVDDTWSALRFRPEAEVKSRGG
jgi:hypothetical protein